MIDIQFLLLIISTELVIIISQLFVFWISNKKTQKIKKTQNIKKPKNPKYENPKYKYNPDDVPGLLDEFFKNKGI